MSVPVVDLFEKVNIPHGYRNASVPVGIGKSNESVVVNVRTIVTRIILVFVIALVI